MLRRLSLAALLVVPSVAAAQPTAPPRRAHHSLVYDEARARVILTGGSTPTNGGQSFEFFNDRWEFDGTRWSPLPPSGAKMSGSSVAYDSRRKRFLAYGGYRGTPVGELRLLTSDGWTTLLEGKEMVAAEPGFIYDRARDRFVAFGGSTGPGSANGTTWEYDGERWTRLSVSSPPPRQAHAMVYDERRRRTIVFGGMGQGAAGQQPPMLGDTWEFDGRTWKQIDVVGPPARLGAGAAYDSRRGQVILFGGAGANGFTGDTWSWNGTEWKKLADTGPSPRVMGYLAYDRARDRVVMFGGRKGYPNGDLNDTWEWDGATWRQVGS